MTASAHDDDVAAKGDDIRDRKDEPRGWPKCPECGTDLYQVLVHVSGEPLTAGSVAKLVWSCEPHDWYWDLKGQPWRPKPEDLA